MTGRYTVTGDVMTIQTEDQVFTGIALMGYDDVQDSVVPCFTLLSEKGEALWGIRATGQE